MQTDLVTTVAELRAVVAAYDAAMQAALVRLETVEKRLDAAEVTIGWIGQETRPRGR
jgi:hypothetical protein